MGPSLPDDRVRATDPQVLVAHGRGDADVAPSVAHTAGPSGSSAEMTVGLARRA